jgi:hypothetical protein
MSHHSNQTVGMFDSVRCNESDNRTIFLVSDFSLCNANTDVCFQVLILSKITGLTVKRLSSPAYRASKGIVRCVVHIFVTELSI